MFLGAMTLFIGDCGRQESCDGLSPDNCIFLNINIKTYYQLPTMAYGQKYGKTPPFCQFPLPLRER